jgi:hypothetical protein
MSELSDSMSYALAAVKAQRSARNERIDKLRGDFNGKYRRAGSEVQGDSIAPGGSWNRGTNATWFTIPVVTTQAFTWITWSRGYSDAYDTIEDAGIRAGEVEAWRCWLLTDDDTLRSVYMHTEWVPHKPMRGSAKEWGVHGWKTRKEAEKYAWEAACFGLTVVIGRVEMWGNIVEHALGYRAEFAAISAVDAIFTSEEAEPLGRIRSKYLDSQP